MKKSNFRERLLEKEKPSGRCSPVFPWSPLPQRRHLNFIEKNRPKNTVTNVNLYPNCDSEVWLRSCEQEILEPLEGIISGTLSNKII